MRFLLKRKGLVVGAVVFVGGVSGVGEAIGDGLKAIARDAVAGRYVLSWYHVWYLVGRRSEEYRV